MNKDKGFLPTILAIIASIVVLAALILLYNFLSTSDDTPGNDTETPQKGTHGETLSAMGRPYIIDMTEDRLSVLKITNSNGSFEFFRGDDGEIYLRGAEQYYYNTEKQKHLYANAATQLLAIEKLEEYEELSEYSLTPETALATIEITDTDNNYYKLYIGAKLATGGSYYAMLDGRDAVYIIDTMLEDYILNATARDYIMPMMLPAISQNDYVSITNFLLKKDGEPFVEIVKMTPEEEEGSIIYGQYKMTHPAQYTPSADNTMRLLQSVSNFGADRILEYNVTEEELDKYGFLTELKYELSYTYNEALYTLYFTDKTENGTYYVYSPLFELIGEISQDKVPYLEWKLIDYVDRLIFVIDIDNISTVELTYPNSTASFVLSGVEDDMIVTYNGEKMDTNSFRYFYKSLMSVAIEGYESMPEGASPYITLTLTTRTNQVLNFEFYEVSSLKSFFTLNGEGEFYVHRDYLRTVVSNLNKIAAGEIITE